MIDSLKLENWVYSEFFDVPTDVELDPAVEELETYIDEIRLQEHPFFSSAMADVEALRLWVSQELVMTNAFSQIVLSAASAIQNVHLRAVLAEVAYGEHGALKGSKAAKSHPWLLNQLRDSLNISPEEVRPMPPTVRFVERLVHFLDDPLTAVAAIGVGNERLIIPEYTAVRKCFSNLLPNAVFQPFLDANTTEDIVHSRLCYEAASRMIALSNGNSRKLYLEAGKSSIDSRVKYFDELAEMID
ncbi:iron-containing redox enzyme family protein [Catellatospora vulcania]|uniref:iron-containing redox enzyme family protein n=1 Tax=Catellatospora vulcania TaxID=1460450 RepID=UPI0012D45E5F|nr:iron-containing redox enzyme family protein [Catellatospora vulcania]